jgi:hypothetical protein
MEASTRPTNQFRAGRSGVALVITLITLSILVALLVAFVSSMSLERQAAHSYEETQRAKLVAQGAVSHAVDLLRTNIPEPALLSESPATAPGENWVINPGRLTILKTNVPAKYVALHTGEVTTAPPAGQPRDAESVDLNAPLPGETIPAITGAAAGIGANRPPMRVKWVNLVQDPSSASGPDNRLVGRYAFWIDDECARLNFNTALGKPAPTAGTTFGDQLTKGAITPTFERGDSKVVYGGGANPSWALGRPQSVNLDSLFDSPNKLLADKLVAHTFLQGFARYPQAIMDFIDVPSPSAWYDQHRYELTFYNRSPEFNTFGKSRYFTTYLPLSLEAGPTYQHPFIYDSSGAFSGTATSPEILHLNSLFGTFGFTSEVVDDEGVSTLGGNAINRAQVEMMLGYLRRTWPGYSNASFFTKYGEAECRQIALNAVLMARMSTTQVATDLATFSKHWSYRSTSVNYSPDSDELKGNTPERFYWRFDIGGQTKLMLPQTPGPHITEVRLFAKAVPASPPPNNAASNLSNFAQPVYLQYWYEVEYYMHPFGPVVDVAEFPVRMDYLDVTAKGPRPNGNTLTRTQQFGPTDAADTRAARNWNTANNTARLATLPDPGTTLGPAGSKYGGNDVPNRRVVRSPVFTVGQRATVVPRIVDNDYSDWDPQPFDAAKAATVSLDIRFRPGMGVLGAPGRPRQMIPLGESSTDTLQAQFNVSIQPTGREQAISWQINDPRLSWDLAKWNVHKQGPGDPSLTGTPGTENRDATGLAIEPAEDSSQRSKFRYIQRAPNGATIDGHVLDRGNEYEPSGRVASPGYWSMLHTGIQSGVPWRTLDFGATAGANTPPDWLLLDLVGATYPMATDQWKIDTALPDAFSTPSYMNSTAGQVNLNSRIYPQTDFFNPPPRTQPLAAVFKNLRSDTEVATLVDHIGAYQSDTEVFDYVGELANVPGGADSGATTWEKESLLRNMAGCLTTKSNTFGVWGVAQVVKKLPKNAQHDSFERGDVVRAEKRFYALVERYVWAGRDGVPGNAHADSTGKWDRLAKQRANITVSDGITDTLFQLPGSPPLFRKASQTRLELDANKDNVGTYPILDGPERVGMNPYAEAALGKIVWNKSSLEDAYNPPQAAIKYRVVYFKYLDP